MRPLALALVLIACAPILPTLTPAPTAGQSGTSPWRSFAPLPTPRSHVATAVAAGPLIYVIGGFAGSQQTFAPSPVVERYDPVADRWERVADLPIPLDHAMAAAVGERVFVFGGRYADGSDRSFRYEPRRNAWEDIAPLPEPRAAGIAVEAPPGLIHVVGGVGRGGPLRTVHIYDPVEDRWRRAADLPTPRDHLAGGAVGDSVCAVGGRGTPGTLVECLRLKSEEGWRRERDLPTAVDDAGAAAVRGQLWVVGRETVVFDGSRWRIAAGPPSQRYGLAVGAARWSLGPGAVIHRLFAIGGVRFGASAATAANEGREVD